MPIFGEVTLKDTVEILAVRLMTEEIRLLASREKVEAGLIEWEKLLFNIMAVIEDAEEKQITNLLVKKWLAKVQNLTYDAEDLLDDSTRKFLLQQADRQPCYTRKFRIPIPHCCTKLFNLRRSVKFDSMIAKQIDAVTSRLEEISTRKDQLQLKEIPEEGIIGYYRTQSTSSSVSTANVYGREIDKEAIVESLMRDDSTTRLIYKFIFSVISITGIAGLGKTTLAQLVYNDDRVNKCFDFQAWVHVDKDFDAVGITKTILAARTNNFSSLQSQLIEKLQNKKFLLVLDDMRSGDYGNWLIFCRPLVLSGLRGSKIIVTTRKQDVASMVSGGGEEGYHQLPKLSKDDCLRVLAHHSLGRENFSDHEYLRGIGEELVKKCNGLPLAAKTLGLLLRGKYDPQYWKNVLHNKV